jgi:YVTN family beta-propeller protein
VQARQAAALGALMSVGTQIAGYRLEELIGRGGMGVVYRAHDVALERPVALKLLAPRLAEDPAFRERFLVESRLAASLDHPNVVPVYDAGEVEGQLYLAMRYVEGTDLKRLLKEQGTLEPGQAIAICAQVANALDAAHARGLVHRDVKPSNVLLDESGHAYLADFGLTRRLSEQAPGFEAGLSLGTPDYVAPEQIEGKDVDARADQYSLACMLHECLTGEPPFPRSSEAATLFAHLEEPPPASQGLEHVMVKALAKDPSERYESCRALVADARSALGLEPKRTRWPLVVAAVGLLLVGLALVGFLVRNEGPVRVASDRAVRIDPETNKVSQTVQVGNEPSGIASAPGSVWVANFADGSVSRIDTAVSRVDRITVNGSPTGLAVSQGVVFVVNGPPAISLTLIKAGSGGAYDTLPIGDDPSFTNGVVAAGPSGVWLADKATWSILHIEPHQGSPSIAARLRIHLRRSVAELNGLAAGANAVWVVGNTVDPRLWGIDSRTGRVVSVVRLPVAPKRVTEGAGGVWVTGEVANVVLRFDPRVNRVVATIPVGEGASGVAVGAGSVWVANSIDGTVSRIDPRTNRVTETIEVGPHPEDVVVADGGVWVTTRRN